MKLVCRSVSALLLVVIFLGAVTVIAADTQKVTKDVYRYDGAIELDEDGIYSDFADALKGTGKETGSISNHGGGQTRMVYTKSGVYFALFTKVEDDDLIGISLIHINDEGGGDLVYDTVQPYRAGGPMVSVMADEEGNVWMYSGWEDAERRDGHYFWDFNAWKYDPTTGETTLYAESRFYKNISSLCYSGGGYSSCSIDIPNHRIFAVVNCGEKPGYMEWAYFDMDTCTWSEMHSVKLDYRYCYTFIVPDGTGGVHLFNLRDVKTDMIKTDFGKSVSSTARNTHTSWYDNNMLFDEWDYFHIPNLDEDVVENQTAVEPAFYDYMHGIYPQYGANSSDIFMDSKGYLHFIFEANEAVVYGDRSVHVVYDVRDGKFEEVFRQHITFAASVKCAYFCRCYEDLEGNFYVACIRAGGSHIEVEVYGSDDPTKEVKFLYGENAIEKDVEASGVGGTALSSSRNGGIMDDKMYIGLCSDSWFCFSIDFAKLRAFLAR